MRFTALPPLEGHAAIAPFQQMNEFPSFPETLRYGQLLGQEETKTVEFKAVQDTKRPVEVIQRYLRDYLNSFLNSDGGSIWFGIEDDGTVRGLFYTTRERDELRQAADVICNTYVPQVDNQLCRIAFIPVLSKMEETDQTKAVLQPPFVDGLSYKAISVHSNKELERLVIVVTILQGKAPVYFTSKTHESAWMRRDGGIVKMSQDVIVQRITYGRRLDQEKTDEWQRLPGRRELAELCLGFLSKKKPETRVLVLHGMASVGKTHIVEYLRQRILADRELFPQKPLIFQLDLKGTSQKREVSQRDALISLIKSMKPDLSLGGIPDEPEEPEQTSLTTTTTQMQSMMSTALPSQLGGLSVFRQDTDAIKAQETIRNQTLINIFTNLTSSVAQGLLVLENVGKVQTLLGLIPAGSPWMVICTSRKPLSLGLHLGGPSVEVFEHNVPPLQPVDGAVLVLQQLPTIPFEEAMNISKLCAGLPQVIRVLCASCRQYGLQPRELVLRLQQIQPGHRLRQIAPGLFSLLMSLRPEQTQALAKVSLFPGFFSEEAVCALLGNSKVDRVFSGTGDLFEQLVNQELVQRVQPPCQGLIFQSWYSVSPGIREFAYQQVEKDLCMQLLDRFFYYFLTLARELRDKATELLGYADESCADKESSIDPGLQLSEKRLKQVQKYQHKGQGTVSQSPGTPATPSMEPSQIISIAASAQPPPNSRAVMPKAPYKQSFIKSQPTQVFELFITCQSSFEMMLRYARLLTGDTRSIIRGKGVQLTLQALDVLSFFSKQFGSDIAKEYDMASAAIRDTKHEKLNLDEASLDFKIWCDCFL